MLQSGIDDATVMVVTIKWRNGVDEMRMHRVTWTQQEGGKIHRDYGQREDAIKWLNILILDCACYDAKLRTVYIK